MKLSLLKICEGIYWILVVYVFIIIAVDATCSVILISSCGISALRVILTRRCNGGVMKSPISRAPP